MTSAPPSQRATAAPNLLRFGLAAWLTLASTGALAEPSTHERLASIAEAYVAAIADHDPLTATALGLAGADGRLVIPSEPARAARIARLDRWKAEVEATMQAAGSAIALVDANDARLLRAEFDSQKNELVVRESDRKDYAGPALRLVDSLFAPFLYLPIVGRDAARADDVDRAWDDIVSRLEQGPAFVVAGQRLVTRPGRLFGTVGSRRLEGAPEFIGGALSEAAQAQLAGRPELLRRFAAGRDALLATLTETRAHIDSRVASWPDNHVIGKAAYERMLREEQLLPFDSADLERMGRDELAHGWSKEAWLTALAHQKKIAFGAASGGGMAPDGPPLVGYYRDRIAELRAFVVAHDVVTVPDWLGAREIVETPAFLQPVSPGASMRAPRRFAKSTTG